MVTWKRLCHESYHFLALTGVPYKYNQCHTTLAGLSSVCAELDPASSKNNEILEMNVLQKFTQHALHHESDEAPTAIPSGYFSALLIVNPLLNRSKDAKCLFL